MNRITLLAISAICTTTLFVSCKHTDKSGILVPKDATFVVHIDGASLATKLPWQEIKQSGWFKDAYAEADDSLAKKLLDNPENAGMNIRASFAFFMKKQGAGGYWVFEGTIKDVAAFEAFNKKIGKDAAVSKDGDISLQTLNKGVTVCWNSTNFAYLLNNPGGGSFMPTGNYSESNAFPADSLRKFGKDLLNLKSDNSLGEDSRFADLLQETGDVHMWINSEQLYNGLAAGVMSMMKLNVLFEGNISATTFNFGDGKISMKSRQYYNKEMQKLTEQYPSHPISADIINRIPSQNVDAVFTMNYPPEGLKEFMKLIGVDGVVNSGMAKINYSMDEFVKANKGDLVFALSDFKIEEKSIQIPGSTETYKSNSPDMKILFATSVNDKPAFDKLVTTLKTQVDQLGHTGMPEITYTLNNGWFAASNSAEYVNKFLAGGNNNQPFASKIGGHSMGAFIDIQKFLTAAAGTSSTTSGEAKEILDASQKMWKDVYIWGDAKTGSEAEINLVDKSTNSLKQLNQYFDKIAAVNKAQRAKWNTMPTDTAAAATVDTTAIAVPNH
ncbi:MAG TPA: DUF4836 family protein [Chitinophagaceae bacterium]|nr:DUF4836 family protein [Chitinophagaceae bacterium]